MSSIKLKKEGWYLLSGIKDSTCETIINSYGKASYLDISSIYIPLSKDFSSNRYTLNPDVNKVTLFGVNNLIFNETIGPILDYNDYRPNHFAHIENLSNTTFSENVGFWVYLYIKQTNPVLQLKINNPLFNNNVPSYTKRAILEIDGIDTTNLENYILDLSRNDISINLIVEREYNNFNYNTIFNGTTVLNNDFTQFSNAGNDYNNITFTGNFTGTYPNKIMNTSSNNNLGQILFTIINSTPNVDQSFNVSINISVRDTIYPTIEFSNPDNIIYDYNSNKTFRGNSSTNTFNTTIKLNQSYIKNNPNQDLSPSTLR